MKNTIKVLVTDIDGTIIPYGERQISRVLHDAFLMLKEKGFHILLATGRNFQMMYPSLFTDLDPDYVVTVNGSCLVDGKGNLIKGYTIDNDVVEELFERCSKKNIALGVKFFDCIVYYTCFDVFEKKFSYAATFDGFFKYYDASNPYHLTHDVVGFMMIGDEKAIDELKIELPQLSIVWAFPQGYDAYPTSFSKAMTIDYLLEKLDLTWSNVIAFGDAENDIEMIKKAKIGVAMADSKQALLDVADFVTLTAKEDGVVFALKHFKLID